MLQLTLRRVVFVESNLPQGTISAFRLTGLNCSQVVLFEREGKMLKEVKCSLCAEELFAPAWSYTNAQAVRNFWHCTNCGYVFESLERKTPVQIERVVREFLAAA